MTRSFSLTSDHLTHDKHSVYVFLKYIILELKQEFPSINSISIFSDGCAGQFKNRFTLSNLLNFYTDFGINVDWSFFATSHGKGAVDGIGATVKRCVWMQTKSGRVIIRNARDFNDCVARSLKGIRCLYVSSEEINLYRKLLEERWKNVPKIPNVQISHYFRPENELLLVGFTAASEFHVVKMK